MVMRMALWESVKTLAPADYAASAVFADALASAEATLRSAKQDLTRFGETAAAATHAAPAVVRAASEGITLDEARRLEAARWLDPPDGDDGGG